MNAAKKQAPGGNHDRGLKLVGYKCPSCNMVAWHDNETDVFCPFCCHALPAWLIKISPERMFKMDTMDQSKMEEHFKDADRGMSPFVLEFFMVQGSGFQCMAYRNGDGKWRGAFDNKELPGAIRVLG